MKREKNRCAKLKRKKVIRFGCVAAVLVSLMCVANPCEVKALTTTFVCVHQTSKSDPATSGYGGDYSQTDDETIYAVVDSGASPSDVDAALYQGATMKAYTPQAIEYALNHGYMLGYVDLLKQGGWIPQDFSPAGSAPAPSETPSTNDASTSSGNESAGQKNTADSNSKTDTKQKSEPTKDESVSGTYVVVNTDTSVYDSYSASKENETYDIGTEVEVTGLYSNGMYEITYHDGKGYIRQKNLVTKEDYEAGWEETDSVAAACTEAGKTVYTNKLSGATKEEEIPAFGHDYVSSETVAATCTKDGKNVFECSRCGDTNEEVIKATGHTEGKWEVTKEPKAFSKGEKVKKCTVCKEVLKTKEIKQTCPLPLWSVIVIAIGCVGAVAAVITVVLKKKMSRKTVVMEENEE